MKTAEEKAFRDKIDRVELEELMYDEFYELVAEAIKIGKASGNEEAMRWRDPKEEPPINQDIVLVKAKAKEYANRCQFLSDFPHDWNSDYRGFIEGYSEAIRWKNPEVELPENGEPVIVKYMTARGIKKYGIAKYFELGIGNPWTIEGSTGREVIGWRPIE